MATKQTILNHLKEMSFLLGGAREMNYKKVDRLRSLHESGQIAECISEIKKLFNLNLTIVLCRLNRVPGNENLSEIFKKYGGKLGYSIENTHLDVLESSSGAAAFVIIPSCMPSFGSAEFENFRIAFFISNQAIESPFETFIACISHEISHILLRSLRRTDWNNEKVVDATAMLMGFDFAFRTAIRSSARPGYLTDEELEFIYKEIQKLKGIIYL